MADDEQELNRTNPFEEIHFISISSQSNVYGLTKYLEKESGCHRLLLACLKGNVISICSPHSSRPSSLSSFTVPFKYIQGNVDVVSIDAFKSSEGLTVGITFIKGLHTNYQKQYLAIYYSKETQSDTKLEAITDRCQLIELDFVPFQLYHTELRDASTKSSNLFLLSGSDKKIHVFAKGDNDQEFSELKTENTFPECHDLPSSVIWMDVYRDHFNKRRITCFACQNGFFKVAVVDEQGQNEILSEWTVVHDGPVSSGRIFTLRAEREKNSEELEGIIPGHQEVRGASNIEDQSIHVLVTGVIEPSVIYQDVLSHGLSKLTILPDSEKYDCVVCSNISDVNWDGNNEILLGTYGQELLVYKLAEDSNETCGKSLRSRLWWKKSFSQPLFAIDYVDVTDDGVRELIVTSSKGLHVLQHKFSEVVERFQDEFADEENEEEKSGGN